MSERTYVRTISWHTRRRTARERRDELRRWQREARMGKHGDAARRRLHEAGVGPDELLEARPYMRGPFFWRVAVVKDAPKPEPPAYQPL